MVQTGIGQVNLWNFPVVLIMSTNFVKCPSCGVNKIPVTKEGPESYPHGLCIQCLGQDHDPFKCSICSVLPKGTIARWELQRKVWIHSGFFMSRAKASSYLKERGWTSLIIMT